MSSAIRAASVARPASSPVPAGALSSARRVRASSAIERPSGVSSWTEAMSAAVTAVTSSTPGAAVIEAASRLPYVMVPVLSRRMTSTSPDASTARPLIARTLNRATRSMPAMPIAERSPPIVVGMRQTRRATRATVSRIVPANWPNGRSVTVTRRNTRVRPARRIDRAISLGVRCRFAPSTRAIIRSRNVSPGSAVIVMTRLSLVRVVPPVTLLRMSVPGSLSTGADSPVMADSLTKPTPSTTSPSPGIVSPSLTTTRSPRRSSAEPTSSSEPSARRRWAVVTERVRRSVAAWARPRASATASAYVANRTVNHSQTAIWTWKPRPAGPVTGWKPVALPRAIRVTRTAVISTMNMTGFLASRRGSSLRTDCGRASRRRSGSRMPRGRCGPAPPEGEAAGRPQRWKRRVPRVRSMERDTKPMPRRPFRRSGGAARRSDPAREPGRS